MADVICRWRNPSPKTVVELVALLPKRPMHSKEFRDYVESESEDFFHTPYQLACQLGLYYEGKDGYIPRFARDITTQEAKDYLEYWITRYYAPNPFTRSLSSLEDPVLLVDSLVKYLEEHGGKAKLKQALTDIFKDPMGNLDIVANTLNQYSKVIKVVDDTASLSVNYKQIMESLPNRKDKKAFFFFFDSDNEEGSKNNSGKGTQVIYYGCPGTGKSYEVMMIAEGKKGKKVIWYDKPTDEHPEGLKREQEPTPEEKKKLDNNIFRTTFHPDYDYATFVGCYKPVKNADGKLDYRFIPQVFTNAYISALRHPEDPTYLIIEEINRGNCAQIFGDLFQLLDRTNGVSDYEIKPDAELARYLASQNVPSESLSLPDNLHIYATMNTSDQSLFPMDSAFKRRWAMEYKPIDYKHGRAMKFTITIDGQDYPWIGFLQMVNEMILGATDSEDKQMGEFFIKGPVTEKEFINKVMFYLWNDVCKDLYNPRRVQAPFFLRVKNQLEDEKNDYFTFAELFSDRNAGSRLLKEFILYLEEKYKESHKDIKLTENKRIDWKTILEETVPTPGTLED